MSEALLSDLVDAGRGFMAAWAPVRNGQVREGDKDAVALGRKHLARVSRLIGAMGSRADEMLGGVDVDELRGAGVDVGAVDPWAFGDDVARVTVVAREALEVAELEEQGREMRGHR